MLALCMPLIVGVQRFDAPREEVLAPRPPVLLELEPTYAPSPARRTAQFEIEPEYRRRHVVAFSARQDQLRPPVSAVAAAAGAAATVGAVALTFDVEIPNGDEARRTLSRVLDTLDARGVRATFFVVGRWAQANPDQLRRMVTEGHEVASHSFTHQHFAGRPSAQLRAELANLAGLVRATTGRGIAPFFRPPFGCLDEPAARVVAEEGYRLVGWNIVGHDARKRTESPRAVVSAVQHTLRSGGTILLHTNRWITAAALPDILDLLAQTRLHPVPVSELFRQQPLVAAIVSRAAHRHCTPVLAGARAGGTRS